MATELILGTITTYQHNNVTILDKTKNIKTFYDQTQPQTTEIGQLKFSLSPFLQTEDEAIMIHRGLVEGH